MERISLRNALFIALTVIAACGICGGGDGGIIDIEPNRPGFDMMTPGTIDLLGKVRIAGNLTHLLLDANSIVTLPNGYVHEKDDTLVVDGNALLILTDSLVTKVSSVFILQSDSKVGSMVSGSGIIINGGKIERTDATTLKEVSWIGPKVENGIGAMIHVRCDTLTLAGGLDNRGTVKIDSGAVLVIKGSFINWPSGKVEGEGTLDISSTTNPTKGLIDTSIHLEE